ncbi:DUF1819 family protein [Allorhodopirellula heiligendammensis]|uniref:Inner membrane protein (DUF1819) n=1 Tax=Allorhodopirellula heiligendammensis TaxID=2714739 RepID=A0A5C6BDY8_9BACT|nr:DUF1819 family protein [Allorhodopirellula heiligendammensis]TWU09952.1 hypothetical protein Poly21_52810 [Allorhodopirellula heiligendammensis]
MRYRADITAGSLKVAESRVIADLLLKQADDAAWKSAMGRDNLLQARSPATARRLSRMIRNRLETMTPDLWKLVRDGNSTAATHACLAAAVKHSELLADFLELVVKEQYRIFADKLTYQLWDDFIADCQNRDAELPDWSESTIKRLRSSVFQILQQAGYIDSTKSLRLQTVHIADEVVRYLTNNDEGSVLRCIQVAP